MEHNDEKVRKKIIEAMLETEELTVLGKHNHGKVTDLLNRLMLRNALKGPKKRHHGKLLDIDNYENDGSVGFL